MGIIEGGIPKKELELEYTSAKIIASPYDYNLSDRILFYNSYNVVNKFNIFNKSYDTEMYLCHKLGLAKDLYMLPYDKIPLTIENPNLSVNIAAIDTYNINFGTSGTMIKWNNLIINEDDLWKDFKSFVSNVCLLKSKYFLKALEVWFLMSTSKASLIPNLFYLTTKFNNRSLEDMENIKFAEEFIADNKAPIIEEILPHKLPELMPENIHSTSIVPNITQYGAAMDGSLYTMGIMYTIVYGMELLYQFDNIKDATLKGALEELLSQDYNTGTFCEEYLYSFNSTGELEVNPLIKACFCDNNELRFSSFRTATDTILSKLSTINEVSKNLNYYSIPKFFQKMVINMHHYAYQVARIKHATLLYKTAKEAGVIDKNDFNDTIDGSGIMGGFGSLAEDEDEENIYEDLFDLSTFSTTGDAPVSPEESVAKEKEVGKKPKEKSSALNAADMLKKDLHDSKYDYDINYVKNSVSDKNAYNLIASNIKMITNELTKQIKEIKTYNTGGKQGGLLVGKLDKKNLWKYKTDPHIFYNNNYKLKEMDLAFGCILDESGSMYGEKIKNGRIVMIMLHEVLNSLGINHSIIGHTSNGMYQSRIFKYFQFKEEAHYSLDKPYGLTKADNRSGNCDSGALYYMQSVMKSVRNKDKIVIIFSDGQPTECTDLDLTEQVKSMEKSGIHVIGVGINFASIKEYYPDNANGKNLKEMVDIVVSILKRYVLEKKED